MKKSILVLVLALYGYVDGVSQLNVSHILDTNLIEQSPSGNWKMYINPDNEIVLKHTFDNQQNGDAFFSFPVKINMTKDASWQFQIKHAYNPSSSNKWIVCFAGNEPASFIYNKGVTNGYAIGINVKDNDDYLKFYKINNGIIEQIHNTGINWQEKVGTEDYADIKIEKSTEGKWQIFFAGPRDTKNLMKTVEFFDNSFSISQFFSLGYHYTSSQDQKLWIKNITIKGDILTDSDAPTFANQTVLNSNTININFNEAIYFNYQKIKGSILLNNSIVPDTIIQVSPYQLSLVFNHPFDLTNQLKISGICDYYENIAQQIMVDFQYFTPGLHDVIISEIMASPDPSSQLPVEYIEIYNTTRYPIYAKDWKICIAEKCKTFNTRLDPNTFYILAETEDTVYFENPIGVEKMNTLPNNEGIVCLKNDLNQIIHYVFYKEEWYKNAYKEGGGWSLEMIDTLYPCIQDGNWTSSQGKNGGTPGYFANNGLSVTFPYETSLIRASILDAKSIRLYFSVDIDKDQLVNRLNYKLNGTVNPEMVYCDQVGFSTICLNFRESFAKNTIYTIEVANDLTDCTGSNLYQNSAKFSMPQSIDSNDIVINEVLFSAGNTGVKFIELYNRSNKTINLDDVLLANRENYSGEITNISQSGNEGFLLLPKNYVVITNSKDHLLSEYTIKDRNIIVNGKLPSMPGNEATLVICDKHLNIIDIVYYTAEMHHSFLTSSNGVSLERINPDNNSLSAQNWHSASSCSGYATPGYANSQYQHDLRVSNKLIFVEPEVFSPDNDGYQDLLSIKIEPPGDGYICKLQIFNGKGRLVKTICDNFLLGSQNFFYWDGTDQVKRLLNTGMYIILCHLTHPDGNVYRLKEICVLGYKMN